MAAVRVKLIVVVVVYMPVVERTVVVFLEVISSYKYLESIIRAVRNLSSNTKPNPIFLKKCVPLLFLQEIQFRI